MRRNMAFDLLLLEMVEMSASRPLVATGGGACGAVAEESLHEPSNLRLFRGARGEHGHGDGVALRSTEAGVEQLNVGAGRGERNHVAADGIGDAVVRLCADDLAAARLRLLHSGTSVLSGHGVEHAGAEH